MLMRMGGVHWRKIRFLLRMVFGVRVEVIVGMVLVLLILTCFVRALFDTGMVFIGFRVRVVSW